ncbi:MAG: DUF2934 domain-containing protein [Vicinamibacterales bacterium]
MPKTRKPASPRRTRPTRSKGPAQKTAADAHTHPSHDDIAARAYELFMRRGGQHGSDWEDWLLAERELAGSMPRALVLTSQSDYAA